MINLLYGQLLMSAYAWISMSVYSFMAFKVLQSRRKLKHFQSSYYSLFLLQFLADFYVFLFVEFIMRARKFNYFNLFSENMHEFAIFSMANVMISRGVLSSGHVVIALNRFITFYMPIRQYQICSNSAVLLSVIFLWCFFIVTSLPVLIIHHDAAHFTFMSNGVLQMTGGMIDEYNSYQGVTVSVITVLVCSVCYVFSYLELRKAQQRYTVVEKRLLLCAVASSFPFCIELVRSTLMLLAFKSKNELYRQITEIWFYETEAIATASVWLQLIINKNVRQLVFSSLVIRKQKTKSSIVFLTNIINNNNKVKNDVVA